MFGKDVKAECIQQCSYRRVRYRLVCYGSSAPICDMASQWVLPTPMPLYIHTDIGSDIGSGIASDEGSDMARNIDDELGCTDMRQQCCQRYWQCYGSNMGGDMSRHIYPDIDRLGIFTLISAG